MTKLLTIFFVLQCQMLLMYGQEIPSSAEQQIENLTDVEQAETEDDSYLQQLEYLRTNRVNLNTAEPNELRELRILTDLQVANLLSYRRIFGKFISIYELQAIPTWDIHTIRKLVPFVSIESTVPLKEGVVPMFRNGEHSLFLRYAQVLEKQKGFDQSLSGAKYLGGPQKIFFRYRYRYKNLLQFGISGDKDAGEQFFKGVQSTGFDFYSFHLFARDLGFIKALAIGDYTVNLGQGLIQWQSMAFKKSADVLGIKRQSAVLRPYNSAGEFNFKRGIGITIRKKNVEATAFASLRKISANFDADTVKNEEFVSSFLMSGNNRTESELADRNSLRQISFGGTIRYAGNRWHLGVNGVYFNFSAPVQKRDEPYNLFAWSGKTWFNMSFDFSYTYKNLHFFCEAAADRNLSKAFLNGLLLSVDPRVDISIIHRAIAKEYQAVNANAFTENTFPTNEHGLFAGITLRPVSRWQINMYADLYRFPWLKYQVDAPSSGKDFLIQIAYSPNRQIEIYSRFRSESKQANTNLTLLQSATSGLAMVTKKNWRIHATYKLTAAITLRNRVEMSWYKGKEETAEQGFLIYADVLYKPLMKPFSGLIRLQYFETGGYNSRLYAYENDVLYSYSIPVFFDKGYRYYATLNYDSSGRLSLWLRVAQTAYIDKDTIGSGLDEIRGTRRTEFKLQVRYLF